MSFIDQIGCYAPVEDLLKFTRQVNVTLAYFDAKIANSPWWDKDRLKRARHAYERDFSRLSDYLWKRIPNLAPVASFIKFNKDGTVSHHDANMKPIDPENEQQTSELQGAWKWAHSKYIKELIGPRPDWDALDEAHKKALEETDGKGIDCP